MDHDWDEVARILLPPPGVLAHSTPVSTLAFDTSYELLWAGNEYGRVTSFYGPELTMYTSFKSHGSQGGQVHQLLFNDRGVIALGSRSIHMAMRRGAPLWNIKHDDMKELRCMTWTSKGTAEILVAGEQDKMFIIDVNKGEISKVLPTSHHYKIMRRSRYICAATTGPVVHILDPLTFSIVKEWTAHAASISDMDAQHDIIVTCGMSPRNQGYVMFDPLVNAFDLKQMVSMVPVPFPSGAAYVRMHPRMSTTSIVVSQSGQMHVVDLVNPNLSTVKQANHFSMKLIDIAPSGEAIALADTDCYIHLWGHQGKLQFAELPTMVDVATPSDPTPQLDFKDDTPLNTIGMPYYREQLLSAWPKDEVYDIGAPPPKEDVEVLKSLTQRTWGYYGKNFRGARRNQVEDTRKLDNERELLTRPKFLSEQAREMSHTPAGTPPPEEIAPGPKKAIIPAVLESHKAEVPPMYRNIEIQFSKFGIDDWDFKHFNATQYSGLQNHIVNSYVNALLQIMHFTPAIRNVALQHAATGCIDEWCLLCELGFLFDMLDKGEGAPCHASNLLKIFGRHDQAAKLGLLEDGTHVVPRTLMLQGFSRFLLDKLVADHKRMAPDSSTVEQLFETSATSTIRCNSCSSETSKPGSTLVHELMYSQNKPSHRNSKTSKVTFSQVLKKSVEREVTNKGWCQICHKYQTLSTKKQIHSIPTVLTLLAGMPTDEYRKLWASPGWLPEEIGVIIKYHQFFCYEGEELKYQLQRGYHDMALYSLTGVATNIETGQVSRPHHLVAMANVAHSAPKAPGESQWYLLNDFHIKRVPGEEALAFNTSWKMPSVITFQRKEANNKLDVSWKENLDSSLLYMDPSLAFPGHQPQAEDKTYQILDRETEQPSPETIIAIDTEFVSTSRQVEMIESETNESRIVRPVVHALARISVLRGSGHLEGVPFIDDYIHIREPVIDYLTAYSGIVPGDLDPAQTRHNLVSLKVAYKKMWILLNLGCKFLGHGLKQDFRVINIHVPQGQIIDTSDLFYSQARKRKLSLQFLAWCLLQEKIQQETHDSIEDARTALRLYRKYQEFIDAGILDMIMQDVFNKGAAYNFRPPVKSSSEGGTGGPPITPRKNMAQSSEFAGGSPGWTPTPRHSAPTPGR